MSTDVEQILQWPRAALSMEEQRALVEHRASLHAEQIRLINTAEREDRDLTAEEAKRYTELQAEYRRAR